MGIRVEKERFAAAIRAADNKSLESQNALWQEVARIYNTGEGLSKRFNKPVDNVITKSIVYQKVRRWGIPVKTERKKAGRPIKETNGHSKEEARALIQEARNCLEIFAITEKWTQHNLGWNLINKFREFLGMNKVDPIDNPEPEHFDA